MTTRFDIIGYKTIYIDGVLIFPEEINVNVQEIPPIMIHEMGGRSTTLEPSTRHFVVEYRINNQQYCWDGPEVYFWKSEMDYRTYAFPYEIEELP